MRPKGALAHAEAVFSPTIEYGVPTEWAVMLTFQSPTGDSGGFIRREIPCVSEDQARQIADAWLGLVTPYEVSA